jgi:hypothetical protein
MAETLLTPSSIKLYGRVMPSLQYADDTTKIDTATMVHEPISIGNNNFLQHQLSSASLAKSFPAVGATSANSRVVTLNPNVEHIRAGMVVTGIVPAAGGADAAQAFLPGTHIVSFTPFEEARPMLAAFPGSPVIASTATTPAYPPALPAAAVGPKPTTPASITLSSDPIVAPANGIIITAWLLGVNLARIYAFSFEGVFYTLPKPALFIVHGPGGDLSGERVGIRRRNGEEFSNLLLGV